MTFWERALAIAIGALVWTGFALLILGPFILLIVKAARRRRRTIKAAMPATAPGFPVVGTFPEGVRPALPVTNDGPGRYRIIGVVSASGADIKMYVDAQTLANAKVKAELKGVVVTDIAKVPDRVEL